LDDPLRERGKALLEELRAGDEGAYAEVFHDHYASLRDYAFSFVQSWDEAADVVQQVFVTLFLERERLGLTEQINVYLFRAVRNRVLNCERDRRVQARCVRRFVATRAPDAVRAWNDGPSAVLRGEIAAKTRQLVNELPERCRDAFLLVRVYHMAYPEAAAVMGITKPTLSSHLMRATKILGQQLTELGLVDGAVKPGGGARRRRVG
jgi:RNA polymerase sigma-70 factor (ECF subfamily)